MLCGLQDNKVSGHGTVGPQDDLDIRRIELGILEMYQKQSP